VRKRNELELVGQHFSLRTSNKIEKIFHVERVEGGLRRSSDLWPDVGQTSVT
jgi:hypothetical protein